MPARDARAAIGTSDDTASVLRAESVQSTTGGMVPSQVDYALFQVIPGGKAYTAGAASDHRVDELEEEAVEAVRRLQERYGYRFAKRAFDIVFSLVVFILFWWLFVAIAVAIKIDDPGGPVFFKQVRVGKDGETFTMHKFRSMLTDAEERRAELESFNEKDGPVFKMKDDPRVTRVGRFIRRTSMDELPQFFDVVAGTMSIVGPRPALPREVETYDERQKKRLLAKPGITCYWQTQRNRDRIPFDEWVDLDLSYIKECSVWTDVKLVGKTISAVFRAQGN